jgi:ribosomal protein S18 acetylase RimI-like enzyme
MTLNITIRPCHPDECAAILDLWKEAGSIPSVSDSVDVLERHLQKDDDLLLVAEYNSRLVGTVMGGWDGWRGNIYRLAVLPDYRRKGIGRALVQEIERRLSLRGARRISICVAKEEDSAVDFWEALKDMNYNRDLRIIRYVKSV